MIVDLLIARAWDGLYALAALTSFVLLIVIGPDVAYYTLATFGVVSWDPPKDVQPVSWQRHLETLCCTIAASPIFIGSLFFTWSCLNLKYTWWWLLPYCGYLLFDQTPNRGGYSSKWLRKSPIFQKTTQYFPTNIVKWHDDTAYPPDKPYMFGYHPVI